VSGLDDYAAIPMWTTWRAVDKRKLPFAIDGTTAKINDPSTWMTRAQAQDCLVEYDHDGVQIALGEANGMLLGGVDLDACLDTEGDLDPWAEAIVKLLDTYTEVSPSGTGLHLFFKCSPELNSKRLRKHVQRKSPRGGKDQGIECYLAKHFMAVTDQTFQHYDTVRILDLDTLDRLQIHMRDFEQKPRKPEVDETERLYSAIAAMANTDLSWEEWNTQGMAIYRATAGTQRGFEAFLRFSQKSTKYDERACDERWRNWRISPPDQVGEGTIFHLAMEAGWQPPARPKTNGHAKNGNGHSYAEEPENVVDLNAYRGSAKLKDETRFPSPAALTEEDLDEDALPARRWLKGRSLIRGELTGIVGDSGVGKSSLELMTAIAVVTGREGLVSETIYETGPAWVHNCEDSHTELRRRVIAILKHFDIPNDEIVGKLFLTSGLDNEFVVLNRDPRSGLLTSTIHVQDCIAHIKDLGIIFANFDPFGSLVDDISENANLEVRKGLVQFRKIAYATDAAVAIDHHTGKAPRGVEHDPTDPNIARGAKAFIDTCRIVQQLTNITNADADRFDINTENKHLYLRRDNGKINIALKDGQALGWYRRETIRLRNSDEVGVVVPHRFETKSQSEQDLERRRDEGRIFAMVERRFNEGLPVSAAPQTKDEGRYLPALMDALPPADRVPYKRARRLLTDMLGRQDLYSITVDSHSKAKGLCTATQYRNLKEKKEE
jgi:hypothetical protein